MSKLNVVRRCYNCGAVLQASNPNEPGFVDQELFDSNNLLLLCKHCWDQQKFNICPNEAKVDKDYLTMLEDARASDAMIVYVVDLFSFESSFVTEICDIIRGLNILVIANKRDLLPSNYPNEKIKEYVAHRFRVAKLPVQAKDVELTSLTSLADISSIVTRVLEQRKRHDVYLVGSLGAGKTLFLNSLLRNYENTTNRAISTSYYPGTTMRVMQIPLDSSSTIYDSLGISIDNNILEKIDAEANKKVYPDEPINCKNVQLSKGESIFIGGLARIDLINGDKENISCYFSNQVQVKKITSNIDATFVKNLEKPTILPTSKTLQNLPDFDAFDIDVDEKGSRDIGIEGLGWISFNGNNQTFRLYVPKGVAIYTTRAKIDNGN